MQAEVGQLEADKAELEKELGTSKVVLRLCHVCMYMCVCVCTRASACATSARGARSVWLAAVVYGWLAGWLFG